MFNPKNHFAKKALCIKSLQTHGWPFFLAGLLTLTICNAGSGLVSAAATQISTALVRQQHQLVPSEPTTNISPVLLQEVNDERKTFQQWIRLLSQFHGDVKPYQQQYAQDSQALRHTTTAQKYQDLLKNLQQQVVSIKIPGLSIEANQLATTLGNQTSAWGSSHNFYDSYNQTSYPMGYEYGPNGSASWIQYDLTTAQTLTDYQQVIEEAYNILYNFQAFKTNAEDSTPWYQPHHTDLVLLQHYGHTSGKAVVVSVNEQALRLYQDGKLVNAFPVTTGRPEKPSAPGNWSVLAKEYQTIFKSDQPKHSRYWYPDTPITYALLYHQGGYFIHDSWWRADYGPGTQFPHIDSSGDHFSYSGSHGCVNVSKSNAAQIFAFVDDNTPVVVY